MRKPNNYENTQAQGEFTPVELGGHTLVIKQVEERMSKTNKPMIVVFFDFAPGDKQAGYFAESFKNDIRPDKKWSNQATQYILTEDENGDCSRSFKTFLTCVEHSNKGFATQWEIISVSSSRENWLAACMVLRWITMMAERWRRGCFVGL